jgi:hypothetical protein
MITQKNKNYLDRCLEFENHTDGFDQNPEIFVAFTIRKSI